MRAALCERVSVALNPKGWERGVSQDQRAQRGLQTHNPNVWCNVWASCPVLHAGYCSMASIIRWLFSLFPYILFGATAMYCNSHNNLFYYSRSRSLINICWYVAIAVRSFHAKSVRVCHPCSLSRCKGAGPERSFYVWRPLLAPLTVTSTAAQLCLNQLFAVIPLQDSSWLRE